MENLSAKVEGRDGRARRAAQFKRRMRSSGPGVIGLFASK
jgi:hypothetical protein